MRHLDTATLEPALRLHRPWLLFVTSGFALLLLGLRMQLTGSHHFLFLVWNLCLAWIPWLLAQAVTLRRLPSIMQWPLLAGWLLFLPNAPYILTDLFHLRPRAGVPLWLDLLLILSFAWAGLMWGFASLRRIDQVIFQSWNRWLASLLAIAALYLSAYGVYLGRYLRFNSWDLIYHPRPILGEVFDVFLHPMAHESAIGFTLGFGTFLVVTYGLYVAAER